MKPDISFTLPIRVRPKGNTKDIILCGGRPRLLARKGERENQAQLIRAAAACAPPRPLDGPVTVHYRFCFAWRRSDSAKRRALHSVPHDVRPDLGNLCKMMDDVLAKAGIVADDARIVCHLMRKVWTHSDGVDVRIWTGAPEL